MATVVLLVPMQDHSTNLCSSRSTTSLRQSRFQRGPNSCPSTLCVFDRFVCLVCLRAPPFREILLPFLAVLFALSVVLAPLLGLLLSLPLSCMHVPLPDLPLVFIVRARPSTRLIVLQAVGFLSTISRHVTVSSTP